MTTVEKQEYLEKIIGKQFADFNIEDLHEIGSNEDTAQYLTIDVAKKLLKENKYNDIHTKLSGFVLLDDFAKGISKIDSKFNSEHEEIWNLITDENADNRFSTLPEHYDDDFIDDLITFVSTEKNCFACGYAYAVLSNLNQESAVITDACKSTISQCFEKMADVNFDNELVTEVIFKFFESILSPVISYFDRKNSELSLIDENDKNAIKVLTHFGLLNEDDINDSDDGNAEELLSSDLVS